MKALLFDSFIDIRKQETRIFLEAQFLLTKKDMLQALSAEFLIVFGKKYKVPEKQLLKLLYEESFGLNKLQLEEVNEK